MNTEALSEQPEPAVKSQPVYVRLCADDAARQHVLVAEAAGLEAVRRVIDALGVRDVAVEVYWYGPEPDTLSGQARVYAFDSMSLLNEALAQRLSSASMGLRLYLAGRESFIWQINKVSMELGLRDDEIQLEACGSQARRVFCVHCRHVTKEVRTNPVSCPNCHVLLEVRDHFSRALAAYIGVVVNAEEPEVKPEPEEVFA